MSPGERIVCRSMRIYLPLYVPISPAPAPALLSLARTRVPVLYMVSFAGSLEFGTFFPLV